MRITAKALQSNTHYLTRFRYCTNLLRSSKSHDFSLTLESMQTFTIQSLFSFFVFIILIIDDFCHSFLDKHFTLIVQFIIQRYKKKKKKILWLVSLRGHVWFEGDASVLTASHTHPHVGYQWFPSLEAVSYGMLHWNTGSCSRLRKLSAFFLPFQLLFS